MLSVIGDVLEGRLSADRANAAARAGSVANKTVALRYEYNNGEDISV